MKPADENICMFYDIFRPACIFIQFPFKVSDDNNDDDGEDGINNNNNNNNSS